jgi:hypothetical protein
MSTSGGNSSLSAVTSPRAGTSVVAALLCIAAVGCSSGTTHRGVSGSTHTSRDVTSTPVGSYYTVGPNGYIVGDDDTDDLYHGHKDYDDAVRHFGREAVGGQLRAVDALARRYYAVAASGDGATGCRLLARSIARRHDFKSIVPPEYAQVADSSLFRDRSCAQVESLLFGLSRRTIAAAAKGTLVVTSLRVRGRHGFALLSFKTLPERQLPVLKEGRTWRIDALLDAEIL